MSTESQATLIKEADEEASLPPELAARAVPVGALSYRMEVEQGLRDDVLFLYDLEVPSGFTPRNQDGEIVEFRLMPAHEVMARVRDGDDFKFNVNLVIIDFALRHGLVDAEDPDYLDLVTGLGARSTDPAHGGNPASARTSCGVRPAARSARRVSARSRLA